MRVGVNRALPDPGREARIIGGRLQVAVAAIGFDQKRSAAVQPHSGKVYQRDRDADPVIGSDHDVADNKLRLIGGLSAGEQSTPTLQ